MVGKMVGQKRKAVEDAPAPVVPKLPAADVEAEAFPRGGGSVLTPLEQRKLALQVKSDVERESANPGNRKENKKSRKDEGDEVRELLRVWGRRRRPAVEHPKLHMHARYYMLTSCAWWTGR